MKTCRTFFRCLRDAFKSVFRNFSLSLASVSCITITLIIIAAALLLSDNVQNFTKEIERDVTIVAFLKSDVSSLDRENFESAVKTNSNIDTFTYKSKVRSFPDCFPRCGNGFHDLGHTVRFVFFRNQICCREAFRLCIGNSNAQPNLLQHPAVVFSIAKCCALEERHSFFLADALQRSRLSCLPIRNFQKLATGCR